MGNSSSAYLVYGILISEEILDKELMEDEGIEYLLPYDPIAPIQISSGGDQCIGYDETYVLGIRASAQHFSMYESEEVKPLVVDASWDEMLKEKAEEIGVPFSQPKWYMQVYYG